MNRSFLRILIVVFELIALSLTIAISVKGMTLTNFDFHQGSEYIESALRCITLAVFASFYYISFSKTFHSSGIFLPMIFLFSILSELRIIEKFSVLTNTVIFPPRLTVNILLFSMFMMASSLIGYGVFYDNQDRKNMSLYSLTSLVCSLILTGLIPHSQNIFSLWGFNIITVLMILMFSICISVFVILIIKDNITSSLIRHFTAIMLIVGNCINIFYDTFIMNIIGTIIYCVACILILILLKINEVIL